MKFFLCKIFVLNEIILFVAWLTFSGTFSSRAFICLYCRAIALYIAQKLYIIAQYAYNSIMIDVGLPFILRMQFT